MNTQLHLNISKIAEIIECQFEGSGEKIIKNLCPLDEQTPDGICFINSQTTEEVEQILASAKCAAIIISDSIEIKAPPSNLTVFRSKTPFYSFLKLTPIFKPKTLIHYGIAESARIGKTTKIGKNVHIGEYCVIGENCTIGDNTTIHPHVVIYNDVKIGENCLIHAHVSIREALSIGNNCVLQNGAVIGGEGFGYLPNAQGEIQTIPQVGTVKLADQVEIGANSCVDRGTIGSTIIGRNTKMDNQVQVGHNVKIGSNSLLCGQVGIGGSCNIGNNVILSGQVGVGDHINISDKCRVAAKSGVIQSLTEAGDYGGHPAIKAISWKRQLALVTNLTNMRVKLLKLLKDRNSEDI